MRSYRRTGGWYGNSVGHALAARGMKLYARKQTMTDPIFYAQKREESVPMAHILDMVRSGESFDNIKRMHPDADQEDLRKRSIKAIEMSEGNGTLSMLDSNGVDMSVNMAENSPRLKESMRETLADPQKASFLHSVKVDALKRRLAA